jgi:Class-II DAHP synthetase family
MSLVLIWGARTPVVRIARMAGQYAKPRSKPTEMHEGKEIPSYRYVQKRSDEEKSMVVYEWFAIEVTMSMALIQVIESLIPKDFFSKWIYNVCIIKFQYCIRANHFVHKRAYFHSAATLNYVRAILGSGFAGKQVHGGRVWWLTLS